jgi:predicted small integral membrane protein
VTKYLKFAAQVAATALAALIAGLLDDRLDFVEWLNVGVMALGSVGVLGAGNLPAGVWRYTKAIVAAASAVLVLWQSLASGGMTSSEWMQLAVAALGAVGVLAAPGPKVYDAAALGRAASGLTNGPV